MKNSRIIVSDTGPLITLEKLPDGFRFIRMLYDKIVVPPAVVKELVQGQFANAEAYFAHYDINDLIKVIDLENEQAWPELELLDKGEQEAIQLALIQKLPLLIEEEAGREIAQRLGLKISGIAGQVLRAFRSSNISAEEASQKLQILYGAGRINKKIHEGLIEVIQKEA